MLSLQVYDSEHVKLGFINSLIIGHQILGGLSELVSIVSNLHYPQLTSQLGHLEENNPRNWGLCDHHGYLPLTNWDDPPNTPLMFKIDPENRPKPQREVVFQASFFKGVC